MYRGGGVHRFRKIFLKNTIFLLPKRNLLNKLYLYLLFAYLYTLHTPRIKLLCKSERPKCALGEMLLVRRKLFGTIELTMSKSIHPC